MAISNRDQLINSMANKAQLCDVNKSSLTAGAGQYWSLWRTTGAPAQGAIPAAAAVCDQTTTGTLRFTQPTGSDYTYVGRQFMMPVNSGTDIQLHDRLAHMGGLSGTVTTAQTVNVDTSVTTSNMANRRGATDYTDLDWWVEIYTAIGTTAQTATVTYTNGAGTSGLTTTVSIGGASPLNQPGKLYPIIGANNEGIRSIQSIQHASTGTAGSYGITCTRLLCTMSCALANYGVVYDWSQTGLPRVHDNACLSLIMLPGTTSTGALIGNFKLIQG